MSLKTPLGRVLGLGAAGAGVDHWWGQRLSAVALVPLTLWFALSLLRLPALDYYTVDAWLSVPLHGVLMVLLIIALAWHSGLGVQVVAEDYLHSPAVRTVVLVLVRLAHVAVAVAGVFAVLLTAVGAHV